MTLHPRYLVLIGPKQILRTAEAVSRYQLLPIWETAVISLFVDADPIIIGRPAQGGVLIGRFFHRLPASGPVKQLSDAQQAAALRTNGLSLMDVGWGGYVTLFQSGDDGPVIVRRDPSGALPCYFAHRNGVVAIASDMELLMAIGAAGRSVDEEEVARHLLAPDLRRQRTCLSHIDELPRGGTLTVKAGRIEMSQHWSPWTFTAPAERFRSLQEARDTLKRVTEHAIRNWASCFRRIVLGVSGGLDSSIVAAGIVGASVPLDCLTLVTDESAGDERYYARQMADALAVPLHEVTLEVGQVDLLSSHAAHLPRPVARSFAQADDRHSMALALRTGADGFFTGAGGDNVFCYQHSVLPIVDRLLTHATPGDTMKTAREIATMAEVGLPKVLALAARRAWLRPRTYRWDLAENLLSADARALRRSVLLHPWLDMPAGELPGKSAHIGYLIKIENHLEGFMRERMHPVIAPLMSQPVIETCLRVPTWFWSEGGQDRAIARTAFKDTLPPAVIDRRTKGGPDGFLLTIFERNRALIAELLLTGRLARSGLLDTVAVEAALRSRGDAARLLHYRLLTLADVEAWMRTVGTEFGDSASLSSLRASQRRY